MLLRFMGFRGLRDAGGRNSTRHHESCEPPNNRHSASLSGLYQVRKCSGCFALSQLLLLRQS